MVGVSREIAVPFRFEPDGGLASVSTDVQVFEQRLKTIIMTRVGERLMLPQFGSPTMEYLFEINDPIAHTELSGFIERAVQTWEPSIIIRKVDVGLNPDSGVMEIQISYSVAPREDVHSTIVSVGGSIQDVVS